MVQPTYSKVLQHCFQSPKIYHHLSPVSSLKPLPGWHINSTPPPGCYNSNYIVLFRYIHTIQSVRTNSTTVLLNTIKHAHSTILNIVDCSIMANVDLKIYDCELIELCTNYIWGGALLIKIHVSINTDGLDKLWVYITADILKSAQVHQNCTRTRRNEATSEGFKWTNKSWHLICRTQTYFLYCSNQSIYSTHNACRWEHIKFSYKKT